MQVSLPFKSLLPVIIFLVVILVIVVEYLHIYILNLDGIDNSNLD